MSVITRNVPAHYKILRMVIQIDGEDAVRVSTDMTIYNANGQQIDDDHPTPAMTAGEETAFLAWWNRNKAAYEAAYGLTELPAPE